MAAIKRIGFVALLLVCFQAAYAYPTDDTALWSNAEPEDTPFEEPTSANDIFPTDVLLELVEGMEALQSEVEAIKGEVEATLSELQGTRADLEMTEVALESSSSALEAIETLMLEEAQRDEGVKSRRGFEENEDSEEDEYDNEESVETRTFDSGKYNTSTFDNS